jgi:glutamine amidotransferase PdxT
MRNSPPIFNINQNDFGRQGMSFQFVEEGFVTSDEAKISVFIENVNV